MTDTRTASERETLAAVARMVRAHCTPSSEAYQAGGDRLIAAVADWIEDPPEWVRSLDEFRSGAPAYPGAEAMLDYVRLLVDGHTNGDYAPDAVLVRLRKLLDQGVVDDGREVPLARPFAELRPAGLLWLINRVVFHPRGYALALQMTDDGVALGWSLLGDGTEPWQFAGDETDDMLRAEATLAAAPEAR